MKSNTPLPKRVRLWTVVVAIAVMVFLLSAFMTPFHTYLFPSRQVELTVENGYGNATYSANFLNYSDINPYIMHNISAEAVAHTSNGSASELYVKMNHAFLSYYGDSPFSRNNSTSAIFVSGEIIINGSLTAGLIPTNLTYNLGISGSVPENESGLIMWDLLPAPSSLFPGNFSNLTPLHGQLPPQLWRYGNSTFWSDFVNLSSNVSTYKFSYYFLYNVWEFYKPGITLNYTFEATINGLSQKMSSTMEFSLVEMLSNGS